MLAIEESQKLTLSNLPSLSLFTGTDQGQFEVMKSCSYLHHTCSTEDMFKGITTSQNATCSDDLDLRI